jgi:hypothetical protein
VLDDLAGKFEAGRIYTEKEFNEVLKRHHNFGDWALLRRELSRMAGSGGMQAMAFYWLKTAAE